MIQKYYRLGLIFGLLLSLIGYGFFYLFFEEDLKALHIAVVGPITGKSSSNGKSYVQGIKLYLNHVNKMGGVNGRKIVLDVYDDQNDKAIAKEKALELIKDNAAIAVIGHNNSDCSIAGGEIYKEHKFPAITPASTNINVTLNNPWYFRVVFNDNLQGKFLSNYTKYVLKYKKASIIHEELAYGTFLTKTFEETAKENGLKIQHKWDFKTTDLDLEKTLAKIVDKLPPPEETGILFLAAHTPEGAKFMRLLRDAGLKHQVLAPDAFASQNFQNALSEFKKEQQYPGYYSDDLLVTTPLIFDNANQKAQNFKERFASAYDSLTPDWRAVYAYDAAVVLVDAFKKTKLEGTLASLANDRKKIRDYLASIDNIKDAVEGATGFNYFDENGDATKPISIGVYKNNQIISSLTQLKSLQNLNEVPDIEKYLEEEKIYYIDKKYFYKTNVVYTGIEINNITNLDMEKLSFTLDFYIWFRYKDKSLKPEELDFINAIEPIKMGEPIEHENIGDVIYKVYQVKGNFRSDSLPVKNGVGEKSLGVTFRHRNLTRNYLIYVIDVLGMGIGKASKETQQSLAHILSPSYGWSIIGNWFFQDIFEKSSLGSPRYLSSHDSSAEYSRFNVGVRVKKDDFTLRRQVNSKWSKIFFWIFLIITLIGAVLTRFRNLKDFTNSFWLVQTFGILFLLFFGEVYLLDSLSNEDNINFKLIILSFDLSWWVIPALQVNQSIEKFLWLPLEIKTEHKIPLMVRKVLAFLVYLLAFFGIVAFVFDQKITSLLATSGMFAMIIGLAIQVNISNIFSGIALNIERPFRVGDWVKIGTLDEGKVLDITWRTTRILTRSALVLSIPNSKASESPISNFSMPDDIVEFWFTVHIDPSISPKFVQKVLLDALYAAEGVIKEPAPYTRLNELTEFSADYMIGYCWRDYGKKNGVRKAVWNSVWTHLHRAGIKPAMQRQDIFIHRAEKARGEVATRPDTLLHEIDMFQTFTDKERVTLSKKIKTIIYEPSEKIVEAGDKNDSMYIIVEGVVSIMAPLDNGEYLEVARLGAGNLFGERAMLTGEPRLVDVVAFTKTWIYEITKQDIAPLLEKHPEIYENFTKLLKKRAQDTSSQKKAKQAPPPPKELSKWERLFKKIKTTLIPDKSDSGQIEKKV